MGPASIKLPYPVGTHSGVPIAESEKNLHFIGQIYSLCFMALNSCPALSQLLGLLSLRATISSLHLVGTGPPWLG